MNALCALIRTPLCPHSPVALPGMSAVGCGSNNHAHYRAVPVSMMTSHNLMVNPGKHAQLAPRSVPLHWAPCHGDRSCQNMHESSSLHACTLFGNY